MNYSLPTEVEIGEISYPIRSDYRAILDIFEVFGDPDLDNDRKALAALDGDEQQRAAAGLALLNEYDGKIKKLLTGIFGAENDFDAILGGVNLAGVGANGKRVVQNLLEALTPILREGAERRLTAAADAAAARADAARAERGAV